MGTETVQFTVSASIIRHLIERQAGTLDKAILELIMNGIDAGAERIEVVFEDDQHISVRDNGRGFRTRDEVEKHFADFGFDHDTKEERGYGRVNGRFGLGRSQIYGFGQSSWRTHTFRMDVDIQSNKELAFELSTGESESVDGCHIDVALYKPLTEVGKEQIRRTLREHVQYAPSSIVVDGDQVNKDVASIKWNAESEHLLFLNKPTATYGLELHNMGIFVNRYTQSDMGVSGVVVSKVPHSFKVTMSRTDVHRSCELWAEMLTMIKPFKETQRRRKQLTDQDRMGIARDWLYGDLPEAAVMRSSRIFKTVKGNYLTLRQLHRHAQGMVTVEMSRYDRVAEAIHESYAIGVLARDFLDWIDARDVGAVVKALNQMAELAYGLPRTEYFEVGDYEKHKAGFNGALITIDKSRWTKLQKAQLASLNSINGHLANGVRYGQKRITTGDKRLLTLGDSDTALAWTDGNNFICLRRTFMNSCFENGMDGILRLIALLVHEQLHTDSDADETHDHSQEFFEAFENVMLSRSLGLFSLAATVVRRYDIERQKLGLPRSMNVAKSLDQVSEAESLGGVDGLPDNELA